jgi:hypothetical protein
MMDHFFQVFWQLPTKTKASLSHSHFRRMTPFKVQVNSYIPMCEGKIDANTLEIWLH